MNMGLRIRLSGMMFLEYAIWGAWMPVLGATLANRHVDPAHIGWTYAALYLALIITPFIGGQFADRLMPSQIFLAISHLLAAGAAFTMAYQHDQNMLVLWLFIWSLLFAPSLGLTNSIALHQIAKQGGDEAKRERDFSLVRTAGTIGWIIAGIILTTYMVRSHADARAATGAIPEMMLTGALGVVMAIYSLLLPNTPPVKDKRTDPLAFRKALGLFKTVPGFTMFMAISFIAATEFQFFYVLSAQYLESLKIPHIYIPIVKSISQATEILALAVLLPIFLPRKGLKWCLLVGSFAWPLRYVIFALGKPIWLVVASLGLHGFGYAFVLVVQQLYCDRVAPSDIRASSQQLLNLITLGIGNFLGSIFCGMVQQHYTVNGITHWVPVFVLPAVTTTVCGLAYLFTFKEAKETAEKPQPIRA